MLLLDGEGKERARLEGYLPNNDFNAALRNGLGRIAFVHKKYSDAERWYGDVVARYGNSHFAPEAMYWRAVARYKATNDHAVLGKVAEELRTIYPSACGRASPFRSCINTNRSTGKDRFARTPHLTGKPAVIHPGRRPGRRNEGWLPENLLIKWRSHAGCGSNLSTVCLL